MDLLELRLPERPASLHSPLTEQLGIDIAELDYSLAHAQTKPACPKLPPRPSEEDLLNADLVQLQRHVEQLSQQLSEVKVDSTRAQKPIPSPMTPLQRAVKQQKRWQSKFERLKERYRALQETFLKSEQSRQAQARQIADLSAVLGRRTR